MKKYQNLSGNSGIDSYEIRPNGIIVRFVDGAEYLYSYLRPGKFEVEKMKVLAREGEGLSTFISVHIKKNFERKVS